MEVRRSGDCISDDDILFRADTQRDLNRAIYEFFGIVRARPDLAHYMIGDPYAAAGILKQVAKILRQYPRLREELDSAHRVKPNDITMVVIPKLPLVLARYDDRAVAFAPTTGCTFLAIDHLVENTGGSDEYIIASSSNGLAQTAWDMAADSPRAILKFLPGSMKPEDFIALGAQGSIRNELFRIPLFPSY